MKKILSVFLALFAALFLVGCKEKTTGTQTQAPQTQGTQGTQGGDQTSVIPTTKTAEELKAELLAKAQEELVESFKNDEASAIRFEFETNFSLSSTSTQKIKAGEETKVLESERKDQVEVINVAGKLSVVFELDLETKSIGLGLYVSDFSLEVEGEHLQSDFKDVLLAKEAVGVEGQEGYKPAEYFDSFSVELFLDSLSVLSIKLSQNFRTIALNAVDKFMEIDKTVKVENGEPVMEDGQYVMIDDPDDVEAKEYALKMINMLLPEREEGSELTDYVLAFDIEEWAKAPEALGEDATPEQEAQYELQNQKYQMYSTVTGMAASPMIPTTVKGIIEMVSAMLPSQGEEDETDPSTEVTEPELTEGEDTDETEPEVTEGEEGEEGEVGGLSTMINMVLGMLHIPFTVTEKEAQKIFAGVSALGLYAYNKAEISESATGYKFELEMDLVNDKLDPESELTLIEAIPMLFNLDEEEEENETEPLDENEEEDLVFENFEITFDAALNFADAKFSEFAVSFNLTGKSTEPDKDEYTDAANEGVVLVDTVYESEATVDLGVSFKYSNTLHIVNLITEESVAGEDYVDLTPIFGGMLDNLIMMMTSKKVEDPAVIGQPE